MLRSGSVESELPHDMSFAADEGVCLYFFEKKKDSDDARSDMKRKQDGNERGLKKNAR